VEYQTDADENRITCKANLAELAKPGRFLVRFRHPAKKPIQSVRVTCQTHAAFDSVKGDAEVTGRSGAPTMFGRARRSGHDGVHQPDIKIYAHESFPGSKPYRSAELLECVAAALRGRSGGFWTNAERLVGGDMADGVHAH
jgi:hypothetical protein